MALAAAYVLSVDENDAEDDISSEEAYTQAMIKQKMTTAKEKYSRGPKILPFVSSDEAPALSEAPTSSDDPLSDISSVCFLPAPKCGNACNTAKGLKCTEIDAYFECGHFQCKETCLRLNECGRCDCKVKVKSFGGGLSWPDPDPYAVGQIGPDGKIIGECDGEHEYDARACPGFYSRMGCYASV